MRKDVRPKGEGLIIAVLLILLIFSVLVPSATAVVLFPGNPNDSSVVVGDTIFFNNVNLTIHRDEAIPVDDIVFAIYRCSDNKQVAHVHFSVFGIKIADTPNGAFTVMNVTNVSNLPYQSGGDYYGYDEQTRWCTPTKFDYDHGYGYGYGYGAVDLMVLYNITYQTQCPGTFYGKLFVNSTTHTYKSAKSASFTVSPKPPCTITIYVDVMPGHWPNRLNTRSHGMFFVAICGTKSFDVHQLDPWSIRFSIDGGKNGIKPICWSYKDVATPWRGIEGGGHSVCGDGYTDLLLKFRNLQNIHVLALFKHRGETLRLTFTGVLKHTCPRVFVEGHDYVQLQDNHGCKSWK
jgi:hypothetical protein